MSHLAIDYHGKGVFKPRQAPAEAPAPDQVQIAVAYTGICGTDLTIAHGGMDHRVTSPWPIGHEMSGTIAEVGSDVDGWKVGDKVTVMPLDWCGECAACVRGYNNVCHNLNFVGIDSPGSLQERWNVRSDLLVPIPAELDLRTAALVEPVAVAVHDVNRAVVTPGSHVVVIGGGPIGLLIALVARNRGADVVISELAPFRLQLAEELGFRVIDPTANDLSAFVAEWTDKKGADFAFEVSGSAAGVAALTEVLTTRGKGVVVAIHGAPAPVNLFQMFWKELEIVGARVYERADFETALDLLMQGVIPADVLITDVMTLEETPAAIERLAGGEDIVKLLVTPS